MRGNPITAPGTGAGTRSIPACAGEPATITAPATGAGGLSPRVRGNHVLGGVAAAGLGSIPACAGEPDSSRFASQRRGVYPRVCGGTWPKSGPQNCPLGLSPRVRGNRVTKLVNGQRNRSIPACAGEPPLGSCRPRPVRVYPRVCGGTVSADSVISHCPGLSPRVRGNPILRWSAITCDGSIPACAGEPAVQVSSHYQQRVYPRVCGGTVGRVSISMPSRGLSPRVRGNRHLRI